MLHQTILLTNTAWVTELKRESKNNTWRMIFFFNVQPVSCDVNENYFFLDFLQSKLFSKWSGLRPATRWKTYKTKRSTWPSNIFPNKYKKKAARFWKRIIVLQTFDVTLIFSATEVLSEHSWSSLPNTMRKHSKS